MPWHERFRGPLEYVLTHNGLSPIFALNETLCKSRSRRHKFPGNDL